MPIQCKFNGRMMLPRRGRFRYGAEPYHKRNVERYGASLHLFALLTPDFASQIDGTQAVSSDGSYSCTCRRFGRWQRSMMRDFAVIGFSHFADAAFVRSHCICDFATQQGSSIQSFLGVDLAGTETVLSRHVVRKNTTRANPSLPSPQFASAAFLPTCGKNIGATNTMSLERRLELLEGRRFP